MHVSVLAAQAVPNDCGIWTFSRAMIKALAEHGSASYRFEVNESQADLEGMLEPSERTCFHRDFMSQVPRWARRLDGHHPRHWAFDRLRDALYQRVFKGWSVSKAFYWRSSLGTSPSNGSKPSSRKSDVFHVPFQALPFWPYHKGLVYTQNVHDFQQEYLPAMQNKRVDEIRRNEYHAYRQASAVCVLGESVKEDAVRFAGIDPDRIFVTPLGNWEMPPPATEEFRDQISQVFGLPEKFIFYPAPTRVHKNHATLIKALAALKKKGMNVTLVTTGKHQPHYDELVDLIRGLGMENDVIFTDYVCLEVLSALYDMATAVVLPTLFEGATGIPLLEAMSKGKPIAAAAICEIPRALGDNGLLFDPHSESEVAEAIERLWESPSLREELARRATHAGRERSWAHFASQCEAAYQYAHAHPNGEAR